MLGHSKAQCGCPVKVSSADRRELEHGDTEGVFLNLEKRLSQRQTYLELANRQRSGWCLKRSQYGLEDVLYKIDQDSTMRVIEPRDRRERLFKDTHRGMFGAHLSDTKVN